MSIRKTKQVSFEVKKSKKGAIYIVSMFAFVLIVSMTGCSKGDKNSVITDDVKQEETQVEQNQMEDEKDNSQDIDNNTPLEEDELEESKDHAGDRDENVNTGVENEEDTSNNDVPEEPSIQDNETDLNTTDPFFITEEGKKIYDVADAFATAFLNQQNDQAKEYMAKDATYDELEDAYDRVQLLDLRLYEYDETSKEASVSYTFVVNGDDSYTYLSMEMIFEDDTYKINMYGLEK